MEIGGKQYVVQALVKTGQGGSRLYVRHVWIQEKLRSGEALKETSAIAAEAGKLSGTSPEGAMASVARRICAVKRTVKDYAQGRREDARFYTHKLVDMEMGMPVHDMQTTEGEATEAGNGTGIACSVGVLVDVGNRVEEGAIPEASRGKGTGEPDERTMPTHFTRGRRGWKRGLSKMGSYPVPHPRERWRVWRGASALSSGR